MVLSDETGPVQAKDDMMTHEADIVADFIESPLKKGGINCHKRNQAPGGKTGSKGHGMFFRNPYIVKPVRELVSEFYKTGPLRHGRRNGDNAGIQLSQP